MSERARALAGRGFRAVFLAACALAVLSGCQVMSTAPGGGDSPIPQTGIQALAPGLSGEVRDAAGQPVAGAEVRVSHSFPGAGSSAQAAVVRTDASGRFHIPEPPRGLVTVEARAGDLCAIRIGVPLRADLVALDLGTLIVAKAGSLTGRLKGPANLKLLGVDIEVLGTPYAAKADEEGRFALSTIPAGKYRIKASRPRFVAPLSAEIEVKSGEVAAAPELLLAPDAPVLAALGATNGAVGAQIDLRGRNFGTEADEPFEVLFGTLRATTVRRESDSRAAVTVPEGAMSGPVSVVRDGVPSDPLPFQVVASLSLTPAYVALRPGESGGLPVTATDIDGLPVAEPAVVWSASDLTRTDRVVPLPDGVKVTPPGEGFFEYAVRSGGIAAKAIVAVGNGSVSTLLGGAEASDKGDGGPAGEARAVRPMGVATGPDGTIYFSDYVANKIRAIGRDGIVRTVRSGLNGPRSLAITADGTLYFTENLGGGKYRVMRVTGDVASEVATGSLYGLAAGPGGIVAVAGADRVYRVDQIQQAGDPMPILADGLTSAICVAFDPGGNLYAGETGRVWRYSGTSRAPVAGGGSYLAPEGRALEVNLRTITALAFFEGSLYFADGSRQVLRQVTSDGKVRTVVGDGFTFPGGAVGRFNGDGLPLGVSLNSPNGLAPHPDGGLIVAESGNGRLRVWRP